MDLLCGYCHAAVGDGDDYIRHDISTHDGLQRVRADHDLCLRWANACICRIADYERVAAKEE